MPEASFDYIKTIPMTLNLIDFPNSLTYVYFNVLTPNPGTENFANSKDINLDLSSALFSLSENLITVQNAFFSV